jgi:hypothetical protein
MVTWSTSIPRSASSSSTSRYDSANRRYQRTASTITSEGKQKPANADRATAAERGRRGLIPTVSLLRRGRRRCNSAPDATAARLCFHLQQPSYNTDTLIGVLDQLGTFYAGQRVVLIWDGLSSHWSHRMRAYLDSQHDWLCAERLPAYAPA